MRDQRESEFMEMLARCERTLFKVCLFYTDRQLSAPQIMCEIAGGACCVSGPVENECYAIATILQGNK